MKDCFRRFLLPSLALLFFAGAFLGSCTDVDDGLGWGLLPDDQELFFSSATLDGVRSYMAFSNEIPVNQRNMMILGNYDTKGNGTTPGGYGHIRSGAAVQFVPGAFSDTDNFLGYLPQADTVWINLYISQIYGDTTKEQKFYIYELTDSIPNTKVLQNINGKDSTAMIYYYPGFDAEEYADMANPLFSFTLKAETTGSSVTKMLEWESGAEDYLKKLVNIDPKIYKESDKAFRNEIYGLYIAPSSDPAEAPLDAALYIMSPITYYNSSYYSYEDWTYFYVQAHNYYEGEPDKDVEPVGDVINGKTYYRKDTVFVRYSFDDSYLSDNTNIIVLERDYEVPGILFDPADFVDTENFQSGVLASETPFYVQGMLGVAGYLDFGQEFKKQLDELCIVDGEQRILKVNRARLYVWLDDDGVSYLKDAPTRLGMYYEYKGYSPKPITDYSYATEQAGYSIPYGGYLNRGMGYYEMDITSYVQNLANQTEDTPQQVWLAPEVTNLFSPRQVSLQNPPLGPSGEPDHKRISLKLTYTLLKKTIDD